MRPKCARSGGSDRPLQAGLAVWQGENGAPSTNNSAGALRDLPWNEVPAGQVAVAPDPHRPLARRRSYQLLPHRRHGELCLDHRAKQHHQREGRFARDRLHHQPAYYAYQNVCALFDGETRRADFLARVEGGAAPVESASFLRKGSAMYIYWAPADLMTDPAPGKARLSLWSGAGARFENPVLVDLLSGEISQPGKMSRSGGTTVVDGCPLRDYPMLIADGSVVA